MNVLFFLATSIPAGLALIGALVCTWQIRWAWTLLGAVILDTFCLWLKKLIQQPRPATPAFVLDSEGLFGMPSEHAAFVFFLTVHLGHRIEHDWGSTSQKLLEWLFLLTWGSTLISVRYAFGAHSLQQLVAGAVIGSLAGITWSRLEVTVQDLLLRGQRFTDASRRCVRLLYGMGTPHND